MLHDLVHAMAPLLWVGVSITFVVLRHRRRMAEITHAQPPAQDHIREVEDLRERIRVLERIATASSLEGRSSTHLAAEIEALRTQ